MEDSPLGICGQTTAASLTRHRLSFFSGQSVKFPPRALTRLSG